MKLSNQPHVHVPNNELTCTYSNHQLQSIVVWKRLTPAQPPVLTLTTARQVNTQPLAAAGQNAETQLRRAFSHAELKSAEGRGEDTQVTNNTALM